MRQTQLFTKIKDIQLDLFYLDLLGVSRAEMMEMLERSNIQGTENITLEDIEFLIRAEGIKYGLASMQKRNKEENKTEIPFKGKK